MSIKYRNSLLLFFLFISIAASFEGLHLIFQNESFDAALLVFIYVLVVSLLELILLLVSLYISIYLFFYLFGLMLSGNLYFLKLDFFSSFNNIADISAVILIVTLGLVLSYLLYLMVYYNKRLSIGLYAYTAVIFMVVPVLMLSNTINDINENNPTSFQQWKNVRFNDRPNIHLISFDAMIPSKIARKYLDIQELPYENTINSYALKKETSFSPRVYTRNSLNSVMNLDQASITHGLKYFSGREESLLSYMFTNNGYEVTTGFMFNYLGNKGKYIDNYNTIYGAPLRETILCVDEQEKSIMHARLFGVCSMFGGYSSIRSIIESNAYVSKWATRNYIKWPEQVLAAIGNLPLKSKPQFSFHYIHKPNKHTPRNYRHINLKQRATYKARLKNEADNLDELLQRLISLIKLQDPKSIVIIFGDHGARLSRGVSKDEDPDFIFQDRHQIELVILKTDHICASDKAFYYSPSFATPSRVLAGVFRCLAENPKAVDQLVNFIEVAAEEAAD